MIRVSYESKHKLEELQEERDYSTYRDAVNGVLKENEQLRQEVDTLQTALGKIPDAE